MRSSLISRLASPIAAALATQLSRPRGWFGRAVMTRVLNRGNRDLIWATLDGVRLAPECRLLDVGFGGGLLLELAHQRGVKRLTGVDPSEAAIEFLRDRAERFPGAEVRLQLGTVEALPFPDSSFDVVASTNTLYFWPDLARAFSELRRVLARDGVLTIGFSSAEKLRTFSAITQHGFHLHDDRAITAAATTAGLAHVRLLELHGRATDGDRVLRALA